MITLPNYPYWRNQLKDVPSADGQPAENKYEDCVPEVLAGAIQFYTGKIVAADDLKDAVYGQGHIGGGDELKYGAYVKAHYGLDLSFTALPSASQAIIDGIRSNLRAGRPTILTMHSQWSRLWNEDAGDGYHAGCAFSIDESDSGLLHVANPWGGFDHVQPVSWWRDRLGIGVWPVAKDAPVLPAGWTDDESTGTLRGSNGVPIVKGFRAHVWSKLIAGQWQGGDAYEAEWGDASGTCQVFAAALLEWTPAGGVVEGTMADALALAAHLKEGKAA